MLESRAEIAAALVTPGAEVNVEEIAFDALERAEVGPFADPKRIGTNLVWTIVDLTPPDVRMRVEGRRIYCRWDRDDPREEGLNAALGLAAALLIERDIEPEPGLVVKLAALLLLPGDGRDLAVDLKHQIYLPEWFILAAHRARGLPSVPPMRVVSR